jgi:hypothetical protein
MSEQLIAVHEALITELAQRMTPMRPVISVAFSSMCAKLRPCVAAPLRGKDLHEIIFYKLKIWGKKEWYFEICSAQVTIMQFMLLPHVVLQCIECPVLWLLFTACAGVLKQLSERFFNSAIREGDFVLFIEKLLLLLFKRSNFLSKNNLKYSTKFSE